MVLSKVKAAGQPPSVPGTEQRTTSSTGVVKQSSTAASAGTGSKKSAATYAKPSGTAESRSDQQMPRVKSSGIRRSNKLHVGGSRSGIDGASCTGQSTSAPSVGASLVTEGTQRSAVRVTRSNGIKKTPSKVKSKSATKKKAVDNASKSKKVPPRVRTGTLPPRPSSPGRQSEKPPTADRSTTRPSTSKKAAKKSSPAPRPTQKHIAERKVVEGGEVREEVPEKKATVNNVTEVAPPKPGGVLKGCKSDDNDRNHAMENGTAKPESALDTNATAGSQIWSVTSGDLSPVHTYLGDSYRSFEEGALKMKETIVQDSKEGLHGLGKSASEWGETKKVDCTENIIPALFADGKMFITQALGAVSAGCGAVTNHLIVQSREVAKAKDLSAVAEGGENVPAELEGNEDKREAQEQQAADHVPAVIAPQLSAITQDDLPVPEDEEEGKASQLHDEEEEVQDTTANMSNDNVVQTTLDNSTSDVPLIEPISTSPVNSMPEHVVETMPSEIGEEIDFVPELEPKPRKKKALWGRSSKKPTK